MKIAVIGAGPVGQTLCASLIDDGNEVVVVEIASSARERLAADGIRVSGVHDLQVAVPRIVPGIEALEGEHIDVVFVAVKAPATELVAGAIEDSVNRDATVVSWQNGIDTERALADAIEPDRIVRAVINHGVSLADDGSVVVTFEHPPHLVREFAPAGSARAEAVSELLTGAGLSTERAEDLDQAVWKKGALNAALNAICALTGLTVMDAWHDRFAGDLARKVLRESIHVARANEIFLGSGFYRYALDYLARAGTHRPSMLLDRIAGRRTEIDFINGKIIEYGQMAGIATPFNEALVALVKAAERSTRQQTTKEE
ncbi:MAG TPA: 2-dehydropantoate 2-reductase [Spirochaetia bacterium]|nr:2-dehydropantoate 2-reductase [Spirochaetia bacterium]